MERVKWGDHKILSFLISREIGERPKHPDTFRTRQLEPNPWETPSRKRFRLASRKKKKNSLLKE